MNEELKERLLAWTKTSSSFGLNSIGKDIEKALEAIDQLERQLAERDVEIAKLIEAVADHVTVRAEQYAELQKYRESPVVAYLNPYGGLLHKLSTGMERETYTIELIVKPGE